MRPQFFLHRAQRPKIDMPALTRNGGEAPVHLDQRRKAQTRARPQHKPGAARRECRGFFADLPHVSGRQDRQAIGQSLEVIEDQPLFEAQLHRRIGAVDQPVRVGELEETPRCGTGGADDHRAGRNRQPADHGARRLHEAWEGVGFGAVQKHCRSARFSAQGIAHIGPAYVAEQKRMGKMHGLSFKACAIM